MDDEEFQAAWAMLEQPEAAKPRRRRSAIHLKGLKHELDAYWSLQQQGFDVEMIANSGRYQRTNSFDITVEGLRLECKARNRQFALFLKWMQTADVVWVATTEEAPLVIMEAATFQALLRAWKERKSDAYEYLYGSSDGAGLREEHHPTDSEGESGRGSSRSKKGPAGRPRRPRRRQGQERARGGADAE